MDRSLFEQAAGEFARRVAGVSGDGWSAATPCTDWDVRQLVNHVVGELLWMPPLFEGQTLEDVGDRFDGDVLGDDPAAAYSAAMTPALRATAEDGALERTVQLSFGETPATEYVAQVTTDLTIHAWDLARGTGQDEQLDGALVDAVYGYLAPQAEGWRSAGAFGPAVDVAAGADAQTRLLGLAGRSTTG